MCDCDLYVAGSPLTCRGWMRLGLSLVSKPKDSDQLRRKASPPLTNKQIFTATTGLIIGDLEISLEMLIVLKAYSFSVLLFLR
jgi:hypothetical protein